MHHKFQSRVARPYPRLHNFLVHLLSCYDSRDTIMSAQDDQMEFIPWYIMVVSRGLGIWPGARKPHGALEAFEFKSSDALCLAYIMMESSDEQEPYKGCPATCSVTFCCS